ncbi:hypothetical protein TSAR_009768 [Trichomalopsis sarcophagae]|uniref:Uncharacterized protein n=1 Tax=Trichomalopsis sarcophagae TaxID=543379 RepID=A0A232F7D2_9HYME|nr:hypothetical protein TSAR_009768 [Trichomalopsis sarcophagae]
MDFLTFQHDLAFSTNAGRGMNAGLLRDNANVLVNSAFINKIFDVNPRHILCTTPQWAANSKEKWKKGCAKSKNKHLPVPWPLASHSRQEWVAWRDCFMTFVNEKYIPNYKQGSLLNEYIGSIGQEIAKNFYFCNSSSETDVNTLFFKFDVYFIFGGRRRHNNESIAEYIVALKDIAEKTAKSNTDKVVKEKLLQDLKCDNIFARFNEIIPSLSNISDYESLSLDELLFIWEECQKPAEYREIFSRWEVKKRDTFEHVQNNSCCLQCDENHTDKLNV